MEDEETQGIVNKARDILDKSMDGEHMRLLHHAMFQFGGEGQDLMSMSLSVGLDPDVEDDWFERCTHWCVCLGHLKQAESTFILPTRHGSQKS